MFSGNAPQSFAPGGLNGFDQQPSNTAGVHSTGDVYSQPPSQGDMTHGQGNSNNQFHGFTGHRWFGQSQSQPMVVVVNNKAPSLTGLGHGEGNSYNQDLNRNRELGSYGGFGQPPSLGDLVKGGVSQNSDGHVDSYNKAPGLSDVDRRGSTETGPASTIKLDDPDLRDLVGISLVGNNFRKFYPNAYHREQDDD